MRWNTRIKWCKLVMPHSKKIQKRTYLRLRTMQACKVCSTTRLYNNKCLTYPATQDNLEGKYTVKKTRRLNQNPKGGGGGDIHLYSSDTRVELKTTHTIFVKIYWVQQNKSKNVMQKNKRNRRRHNLSCQLDSNPSAPPIAYREPIVWWSRGAQPRATRA